MYHNDVGCPHGVGRVTSLGENTELHPHLHARARITHARLRHTHRITHTCAFPLASLGVCYAHSQRRLQHLTHSHALDLTCRVRCYTCARMPSHTRERMFHASSSLPPLTVGVRGTQQVGMRLSLRGHALYRRIRGLLAGSSQGSPRTADVIEHALGLYLRVLQANARNRATSNVSGLSEGKTRKSSLDRVPVAVRERN